jgi:hypothetical protein
MGRFRKQRTRRAVYDAVQQMVGVIGSDPDVARALKNRARRNDL